MEGRSRNLQVYDDEVIIDGSEFDALREAVEVLEGMPHAEDAELQYYRHQMNVARDHVLEVIEEADEAIDAVTILEDLLDHEREAGKGFRLAAADYYGQTLDLKAKNRELTSELNDPRGTEAYYLACWEAERDAHDRTKAALRDAEAKIKELHEQLATLGGSYMEQLVRANVAEAKVKELRWPRFEVVASSVYDTQNGKYAPFGSPETARMAARDFNAGTDAPGKYIWKDNLNS